MKVFRIAILCATVMLSSATVAATYFSEVGTSGRVKRTIVAPDEHAADGETWVSQLLGGAWKRTYIDGSQRGAYAGIGSIYDGSSNTFKPFGLTIIGDSIIMEMATAQSMLPLPFPTAQNLGVDGDKTTQIQARLSSISSKTTHVVLEGGTNDFFQAVDGNIIPAYTAILNSLTGSRKVLLLGIPPVDEAAMDQSRLPFLNNSKITAKNAQLATLCASYANCFMLSVRYMDMTGKAPDGVHPYQWAYQEIAARILEAL